MQGCFKFRAMSSLPIMSPPPPHSLTHPTFLIFPSLETRFYDQIFDMQKIDRKWFHCVHTRCVHAKLPAHNKCLFPPPSTVAHSPPEPFHTNLHSALSLPLSTNKTKVSQAALWLCCNCGTLTDYTGFFPPNGISKEYSLLILADTDIMK